MVLHWDRSGGKVLLPDAAGRLPSPLKYSIAPAHDVSLRPMSFLPYHQFQEPGSGVELTSEAMLRKQREQ